MGCPRRRTSWRWSARMPRGTGGRAPTGSPPPPAHPPSSPAAQRLHDRGARSRCRRRAGAPRRAARPGRDGEGVGGRPSRAPFTRPRARGSRLARRRHRHRRRRPAGGLARTCDRRSPRRLRGTRTDDHDHRRRPCHLEHDGAPLAEGAAPACTTSSTPHGRARARASGARFQRRCRELHRREHREHRGTHSRYRRSRLALASSGSPRASSRTTASRSTVAGWPLQDARAPVAA